MVQSPNSCVFIASSHIYEFKENKGAPSRCKESNHLVTWCSLALQVEWWPLWQSCICRGHWYSIRKPMPRKHWIGGQSLFHCLWIQRPELMGWEVGERNHVKSSQAIQMSLNPYIKDFWPFTSIAWWLWMMVMDDWNAWVRQVWGSDVSRSGTGPAARKQQIPNLVEWESENSVDLWPKFFVVQNQIGIWHVFDMLCYCQKIHLPKMGLGLWITTLKGLQFQVSHMWHDLTIWPRLLKCSRWVKKTVFRKGPNRPR